MKCMENQISTLQFCSHKKKCRAPYRVSLLHKYNNNTVSWIKSHIFVMEKPVYSHTKDHPAVIKISQLNASVKSLLKKK